jgi:hypothetical protein
MKSSETERTLTCDRCGAAVSPTGWPENHVCIPQPEAASEARFPRSDLTHSEVMDRLYYTVGYSPEGVEVEHTDAVLRAALDGMSAMLDRIAETVGDYFNPRAEECIADGVDGLLDELEAQKQYRDAAEAKLKKAEEVIKTLTIADDRHFDEMSKRGHRADAAVARVEKLEAELETWKNADISRTLRAHAEHEAEGLAAMLTTTTRRADAVESRAATLKKALREIKNIPNQMTGGDWTEIEDARRVAIAALKEKT